MIVQNLYLEHFRCYEKAYFEFSPHLNLICGPNARGKTSLLEALHLLMIGRSFRTTQNRDLIKHQASYYQLQINFIKHGVEQTLRFVSSTEEKKIFLNTTALHSLSSLLGLIPGVLQTPDDISLIKGSPQKRRQFLDIQIAQTDPLYVHHLMRYKKAMQQRNQLLRLKKLAAIEVWEEEMGQSAAYLTLKRYHTIQNLQYHCKSLYPSLTAEAAHFTLKYRTQAFITDSIKHHEIKSFFLKQYQKFHEREKVLGYTLYGAHKDDFQLMINDQDVRFFASEGQQRSCITTLHLAEWLNLKQTGKELPLFLIDDASLGLDKERSKRLILQFSQLGQIFLTTTDQTLFSHYLGNKKAFAL